MLEFRQAACLPRRAVRPEVRATKLPGVPSGRQRASRAADNPSIGCRPYRGKAHIKS
jgi:hypothetical protein